MDGTLVFFSILYGLAFLSTAITEPKKLAIRMYLFSSMIVLASYLDDSLREKVYTVPSLYEKEEREGKLLFLFFPSLLIWYILEHF